MKTVYAALQPKCFILLTVILMKAAVTRQAISSKDFLQVGFPCILHSLILKQTDLSRPLCFSEAQKSKKCPLKTAKYHLAKDYRLHSLSFCRHSIDKTIKSGSETHRQEISKNKPDAQNIIWSIYEQSHSSRDFLVPFLAYNLCYPPFCNNMEIMIPSFS